MTHRHREGFFSPEFEAPPKAAEALTLNPAGFPSKLFSFNPEPAATTEFTPRVTLLFLPGQTRYDPSNCLSAVAACSRLNNDWLY
jgi:hypothetical protein